MTVSQVILIFLHLILIFLTFSVVMHLKAIYRAQALQMEQAKILNDNLMENAERLGELGRETSTRLADEIMHERQEAEATAEKRFRP